MHSIESAAVSTDLAPAPDLAKVVEEPGRRDEPSRQVRQPTHQTGEFRIQAAVPPETNAEVRVGDAGPPFLQQAILVRL